MIKGLASGILSGGIVGALVLSVLSLYAPLPQDRIDAAPRLEVTQSEAETAPASVDPTAAPAVAAETETETLAPEASEQVAPAASDESAQAVDAPVIKSDAAAPAQTASIKAESASMATQVATPVATVETASSAPAGTTAQASGVTTEATPTATAESLRATDTDVVAEAAAALDAAPTDGTAPTLSSDNAEIATRVQPSGLTSPTIVGEEQTPGTDTSTKVAAVAPAPAAPKLPTIGEETTQAEPASADTPIVLPAPKVPGVVTNRLPSVTASTPTTTPEQLPEAAPDADDTDDTRGALERFAAPFEGAEGKALMSFVLIDSGADGLPRDDLKSLAVPITIALDPVAPDAAAIMAEYRAAGIEVVTLANDLPAASGPGDVAVSVSAYFEVLNQSVALMDPLDGRIQANRSLLQPVLGAIRNSGHGLITYDRGLNTAQQAARHENIPAATVFRVLDADLEQAPKIKRYLDRAAFTANQDGAVVVVGRSYPDTVKALVEWSLEKKDASIAVVPVSAVMMAQANS